MGAISLMHMSNSDLMVQAAAAGLSIACVPETYAQAELDSGRLVTVLQDWCPPIAGLMLYYPGHRLVPSALRAFIDVIREVEAQAQRGRTSPQSSAAR